MWLTFVFAKKNKKLSLKLSGNNKVGYHLTFYVFRMLAQRLYLFQEGIEFTNNPM